MTVPFALFTPAFYADPYPAYRWLQEHAPVYHDARMGWLVTRYADITALAHDPRLSRAGFEATRVAGVLAEAQVIAQPVLAGLRLELSKTDPPNHTRLRRLVSMAFTPRVVERMRPRIQALVDELLDAVAARGELDVIRDVAYPLPALVIMELLGVPAADRDQVKRWTANRIAFLGSIRVAPDPVAVAAQARDSAAAHTAYFRELLTQRRRAPGDDLLTALLQVEAADDGRLSEEELVANAMHLLTGGHETTTSLIGNGLLALLRHPDQLQRLRTQPALMPVAVEELLRYDSAVQFAPRATSEPVEIAGQAIPAGERVLLTLGAANRDPVQFAEPDRFDITRQPNDHLAFGFGYHFCLGAHLARLEAQLVFSTLLSRFADLTVAAPDLQWHANPAYHGLTALPLDFTPA